MVSQPVLPPSGHRTYPETEPYKEISNPLSVLAKFPQHDTWDCGYSMALITAIVSTVLTTGCATGLVLLTVFFKIFGLGPDPDNRRDR
ncbi:hypothetical protein ODJ79_11375 [Actinoplanes sp. KI2]|uniref:hypothetical protein n=1 Tax=Actinoplanes sp. KI2 TaxID=2983315 RepID=UPI0021D5E412|nr:hypothetical protein [Actinoplanes sp. KI2]MCU7724317.1 hypothetical protein [Actinoplanes sp. KI2]